MGKNRNWIRSKKRSATHLRRNAEDRAFREKVYRSAFAALERATASHPELTVETAIRRRRSLQAKITSIESEYLPAAPAPAGPPRRSAHRLARRTASCG